MVGKTVYVYPFPSARKECLYAFTIWCPLTKHSPFGVREVVKGTAEKHGIRLLASAESQIWARGIPPIGALDPPGQGEFRRQAAFP